MAIQQQITHRQFISLIIVFFLGAFTVVGFHTVAPAGTSGWLAIAIAMTVGLILALIINTLHNIFPGKTLIEYSQIILGKPLGKLLCFFYLLYFIYLFSLITSDLALVYTNMFYTRTPVWVFYLSLYFLCLLVALGGLLAVGRMGELSTPLLALVVFVVTLSMLFSPNISFAHLFPLFIHEYKPILQGAWLNFSFLFGNIIIFAMFIPYVQGKQRVLQDLAKGILLSGGLVILISLLNLLAFGIERLEDTTYTSALMLRIIEVGGFIERIESIIVAAWLLVLFVEGLVVFYATGLAVSQILNLKNIQITWIPIIVLTFFINLFILNSEFAQRYVDTAITPYSFVLQLAVPIILLLLAKLENL